MVNPASCGISEQKIIDDQVLGKQLSGDLLIKNLSLSYKCRLGKIVCKEHWEINSSLSIVTYINIYPSIGADSISARFYHAWFVTKCVQGCGCGGSLVQAPQPAHSWLFSHIYRKGDHGATFQELTPDHYVKANALGFPLSPEKPGCNVFCTLKLLCLSGTFHFVSVFLSPRCSVRLIVLLGLLQVHVVLKLWKSGFSLDSGELRSYQDPSNAQFLDDIRRGYVVRGERSNSCFLKHKCLWNPGL